MSIIISGYPNTGKTYLAGLFADLGIFHADSLHEDGLVLRAQDEEISLQLSLGDHQIYEGCMMVRGVRHFLETFSDTPPCEVFIWMARPRQALTPAQIKFSKGLLTVFGEIKTQLEDLGVVLLVSLPTSIMVSAGSMDWDGSSEDAKPFRIQKVPAR